MGKADHGGEFDKGERAGGDEGGCLQESAASFSSLFLPSFRNSKLQSGPAGVGGGRGTGTLRAATAAAGPGDGRGSIWQQIVPSFTGLVLVPGGRAGRGEGRVARGPVIAVVCAAGGRGPSHGARCCRGERRFLSSRLSAANRPTRCDAVRRGEEGRQEEVDRGLARRRSTKLAAPGPPCVHSSRPAVPASQHTAAAPEGRPFPPCLRRLRGSPPPWHRRSL